MKTAASPQQRSAGKDSKGGGGARKPFFSVAVQRKAQPASSKTADEPIQARLKVGQPDDRYEVEADRVADRVVDGKGAGQLASGISPIAQRQAEEPAAEAGGAAAAVPEMDDATLLAANTALGSEETVQRKAEPTGDETLQRKAEPLGDETLQRKAEPAGDETLQRAPSPRPSPRGGEGEKQSVQSGEQEQPVQAAGLEAEQPLQAEGAPAGTTASTEVSRQIQAARGGGNPLPGPVREKMEAQFGTALDGVRIHTDAPAVLLAQSLKAQAFTRGADIFFNEGRFAPDSRSGEHLLAHELTHVMQQREGISLPPKPAPETAGDGQPATPSAAEQDVIRLAPEESGSYQMRPELLEAIRLARGEIGKVNAKKSDADGRRTGWERLREYFHTALGGPKIAEQVIERVTTIEKTGADGKKSRMDALPSWCGIFTWWALKKAGLPIPDWKLGTPALEAFRQRKPGELPRKGDIVIHLRPNNHFAMVTGLKGAQDGGGKPRVATINGNTAGADNLGGQVQEHTHDLKHWDFVFDPVGKLNLPPVPLVTVEQAPTPIEQPPAGAAGTIETTSDGSAAGAQTASERGPSVDEVDLDSPVAEPPVEESAETLPEPDLSLPPPADQGPAEQVAEVQQVDMTGSSDQATTAFIDATPSSMAATQPQLGPAVDGKMKSEQQDLVDNPPVLAVKTAGTLDEPLAAPVEVPAAAEAELGDGVKGPDPGALPGATVAAPAAFNGNGERQRELDDEDSGSFWDRFTSFLKKFVTGIRTKDDSIDTRAGSAPQVAMSGEADPGRMDTPREEGTSALKAQRDSQVTAFREHPGQGRIQPKALDEQRPIAVASEPTASIDPQQDDKVAAYAAAPLPQDVRDNADARISKTLTPNLASARQQTTDAAGSRDSDSQQEIDTSQAAAKKLNEDTDAAQRKLVLDNRGEVAKLQGEGIGEANAQVTAFGKEASTEQGKARKDIGEHVRSEEGKAQTELANGEKDAEHEKAEGERKAAEKKKELEKEQEKGSWWDRVKSAIKKAVKVITDAIDAVFTAVRKAVKNIIEKAKNAAIGLINKARDWVVNKLNDFRNWAKTQVDKYLKDTFPNLAKRINAGIDAVADTAIKGVNKLADAAIEGINKLADALAKALDKILATFQTALKTAVRVVGAVLQGDFAEALRAAIEGACEIAGVDSKPVFEFFDRAGKAIMSILKDPVGFIRKLFGAVGDGVGNFFKNIKNHLIQGVIGWLTGALSEVNITGPFEFSPRGILSIVLQVLGLTYANIKARVIRKVPAAAKVFDLVEKGYALLNRILTEGPGALWEEIKARISSLKETVMGAIRNWLIVTAIKEGIVWLLSLTNPASAIVKAIKLVYDLVMFLVERYQQIKDFILRIYEAVAAVAAGNFTKVTQAVEGALARSVPVLISLFASVLGLGNIAKQVKNVINTITKPINKAIDWVIDKVVAFAKKLLAKIKSGAKKVKDKARAAAGKLLNWWKARAGFKDETGHSHSLSYQGEKKAAKLYVASDPEQIEPFINSRFKASKPGSPERTLAEGARQHYRDKVVPAQNALIAADNVSSTVKKSKGHDDNQKLAAALQQELNTLGTQWLSKMFGAGDKNFPPPMLPVMSDNVKARSLTADYIVNAPGYRHAVKTGTESTAHKGNLQGWTAIPIALRANQSWVRMHLLPHKLGGNAVDSNLTPASGPKYNIPFASSVEGSAKKKAVEGDPAQREPIWYKFTIGYHPDKAGGESPWPNRLRAEWGTYEKKGEQWKRKDAATDFKDVAPDYPTFGTVIPDLNHVDTTAGEIADAAGVDRGFAILILNLRDDLPGKTFGTSAAGFSNQMNSRYVDPTTREHLRGVQNYPARLAKVQGAIASGKILMH